jgi:hypothetical protein
MRSKEPAKKKTKSSRPNVKDEKKIKKYNGKKENPSQLRVT